MIKCEESKNDKTKITDRANQSGESRPSEIRLFAVRPFLYWGTS